MERDFNVYEKVPPVSKRIHIIDDDPVMRELLKASLTKKGFSVTVSPDAYQIFDFPDKLPDLFLLDVVIPGLNGLETGKWLKSQDPGVKIIILSGTPGLKVLSENIHADDFLTKPFEFSKLLEKINRCLREEKLPV